MTTPKRYFGVNLTQYFHPLMRIHKDPRMIDGATQKKVVSQLIRDELNENKTTYEAVETTFENVRNHGGIAPQVILVGNNWSIVSLTTKQLVNLNKFSFWTFNCSSLRFNKLSNQMFFPLEIGKQNINFNENSELINKIGLSNPHQLHLVGAQLDLYSQLRAANSLMARESFLYVSQVGNDCNLKTFNNNSSNFYWGEVAKQRYVSDPLIRTYIVQSKILELTCGALRTNSLDSIERLRSGEEINVNIYNDIDINHNNSKGAIIL